MADTAIVTSPAPKAPAAAPRTRFLDSDLWASFKRSKVTMAAAFVTALFFAAAVLAGVLSPQNPFDPAQLELLNSRVPPLWESGGQTPFLLGTDQQGRDMLSAILYGLRISLVVGVLGVAFSATLGIALGLIAGYLGGAVDTVIMRIADVQLTFPAILIALLIDGVVKSVLGNQLDAGTVLGVLVFSIGLSFWVQYARTVRGSVMVEKNKEYVAAARLMADEDVADPRVVEGVVGREVRPSGVAEYDVDALRLEALHDGIDCAHRATTLPSRFRAHRRAGTAKGTPRRPRKRACGRQVAGAGRRSASCSDSTARSGKSRSCPQAMHIWS